MSKTIPKTWNPEEYEKKLYAHWEQSGYFKPEINPEGGPYTIIMPPPNVTGKLHLGHALVNTIEDIMTRFARMNGKAALWLPGADHAGIATQTVVDRELRKQGINKKDLGREKFVERVWEWKKEYGGIITEQIRRMGSSCDWSRERFTLDKGMSVAVREAFVRLYEKKLIYRAEYLVNWCPKCGTAISDDEVEHQEQTGKLYYFRYDKNFPITIATTRLETKLGDTAVAVNPADDRYKQYVGKEFDINLDGITRKIKVISDRIVDQKFGTGAVGVTPAHSATDWRLADDYHLDRVKIIDEHGRMAETAGKYVGLKVLEAREKLVEYLKASGLLEKVEDISNNLSVCYRCGGAIEPLPSLQWFVDMKVLAIKAKKAVTDGKINIIPKRFEKVYYHWLDNIRDWCISRQLWWGHQLPVYYHKPEEVQSPKSKVQNDNRNNAIDTRGVSSGSPGVGDNEVYVGLEPPKEDGWTQDPDVLDTWFSSALWPFSTLGWPNQPSDFAKFYPTTVMETGYDILFFWVAKMIMMGLELTGEVPFKTVYLHGLVRDEHNRKMSKSLGNSVDPLQMIDKYGTDALRMSLVVGTTPGQDVPMGEGKIKGYRNFSNKIWNASRFVLINVSAGDMAAGELGSCQLQDLNIDDSILTEADKQVLKVHKVIKSKVKKYLDEYKFSQAGELLYDFFWHDFCDNYIEAAKQQIGIRNQELGIMDQKNPNSSFLIHNSKEVRENTKKILTKVLSETLQLLHPFIPFVTEAVWQELREVCPELSESIMISTWPK